MFSLYVGGRKVNNVPKKVSIMTFIFKSDSEIYGDLLLASGAFFKF